MSTTNPAENIIVYSKPACQQCVMTMRYLNKHQIPHTHKDITEDPAAYNRTQELGYTAAPVVEVLDTNHSWYGFNPDELAKLHS